MNELSLIRDVQIGHPLEPACLRLSMVQACYHQQRMRRDDMTIPYKAGAHVYRRKNLTP